MSFPKAAEKLDTVGGDFHRRGWVSGTSGNFGSICGKIRRRTTSACGGTDFIPGASIAEVNRHIEIFEFLFEVPGRQLH